MASRFGEERRGRDYLSSLNADLPVANEFAHRALHGRSTDALVELVSEAEGEHRDHHALGLLGEDVGE